MALRSRVAMLIWPINKSLKLQSIHFCDNGIADGLIKQILFVFGIKVNNDGDNDLFDASNYMKVPGYRSSKLGSIIDDINTGQGKMFIPLGEESKA